MALPAPSSPDGYWGCPQGCPWPRLSACSDPFSPGPGPTRCRCPPAAHRDLQVGPVQQSCYSSRRRGAGARLSHKVGSSHPLFPPLCSSLSWLLTVLGFIPNLPSPSPRLYWMRAKRPESASVALTLRMTVPSGTSSKTAFCKKKGAGRAGCCTLCHFSRKTELIPVNTS